MIDALMMYMMVVCLVRLRRHGRHGSEMVEVGPDIARQEVECKLNRFDFFHDELHNLQRIRLPVQLVNHGGLLNKNRMDQLQSLLFKLEASL